MDKKVKYEYKEMLASVAKRFYEGHYSPGFDSGDISIRDPETGYIYAYPDMKEGFHLSNWGELRAENIAVIDSDGNLVEKDYKPTIEIPMHLAIYKARPETTVILHSHPRWSAIFACARKDIPFCLAEQGLFLGGKTVCADYAPAGSWEIANNIVKALEKDRNAALLANHGAVVLANSLNEAFARHDFLEHAAMVAMFAESLGGVHEITMSELLDPSLMS